MTILYGLQNYNHSMVFHEPLDDPHNYTYSFLTKKQQHLKWSEMYAWLNMIEFGSLDDHHNYL